MGTAYHWYILADQVITKLDANSYMTEMVGVKYKLAHRRADKDAWSASERAQRKHLVQVLEELIAEAGAGSHADRRAAGAEARTCEDRTASCSIITAPQAARPPRRGVMDSPPRPRRRSFHAVRVDLHTAREESDARRSGVLVTSRPACPCRASR